MCKPYLSELIPLLEKFLYLRDFYLLDCVSCQVVERLKVYLLISDEDISVDGVERQHSACEYIGFFEHRFFRHAVDLAHIERFLIELVDDHLVDTLLQVVIAFLLGIFVQEDNPLLQVLNVLVRWEDGCVTNYILICYVRSS